MCAEKTKHGMQVRMGFTGCIYLVISSLTIRFLHIAYKFLLSGFVLAHEPSDKIRFRISL